MQNEWIDISAQLGNHERHAMGHQATNKMYVATKPVQLGDGDVTLEPLGSSEGGLELRAAVKGV